MNKILKIVIGIGIAVAMASDVKAQGSLTAPQLATVSTGTDKLPLVPTGGFYYRSFLKYDSIQITNAGGAGSTPVINTNLYWGSNIVAWTQVAPFNTTIGLRTFVTNALIDPYAWQMALTNVGGFMAGGGANNAFFAQYNTLSTNGFPSTAAPSVPDGPGWQDVDLWTSAGGGMATNIAVAVTASGWTGTTTNALSIILLPSPNGQYFNVGNPLLANCPLMNGTNIIQTNIQLTTSFLLGARRVRLMAIIGGTNVSATTNMVYDVALTGTGQ